MGVVLLIVIGTGCGFLLLRGLRRPGGIYEYPFLAAAVFSGFVLPQLIGLSIGGHIPGEGVLKTSIMTALCLLMIYLGSTVRVNPMHSMNWLFDKNRLLFVSVFLSLFGAFFFFQISRLPAEVVSTGRWSGAVVMYWFFGSALKYGFALAVLIFTATSSRFALGVILFDTVFYLDRIIVGARRGDAVEFVLVILLLFWFQRRRSIPRVFAIIGIILATLFLYGTGEYRVSMASGDEGVVETIESIEFVDNFRTIVTQGGAELRNAAYQIEAIDRAMEFDYGAFHWNKLVFNYIPAQILGSGFKESLYIPVRDLALLIYGYRGMGGSTDTGMTDSFHSFWYFGAVKFFLIAFILHKLYVSAMAGHSIAQLLYALMIVNGLHAITHNTHWFISPWVHMMIFLFPALMFAKSGRRAVTDSQQPPGRLSQCA